MANQLFFHPPPRNISRSCPPHTKFQDLSACHFCYPSNNRHHAIEAILELNEIKRLCPQHNKTQSPPFLEGKSRRLSYHGSVVLDNWKIINNLPWETRANNVIGLTDDSFANSNTLINFGINIENKTSKISLGFMSTLNNEFLGQKLLNYELNVHTPAKWNTYTVPANEYWTSLKNQAKQIPPLAFYTLPLQPGKNITIGPVIKNNFRNDHRIYGLAVGHLKLGLNNFQLVYNMETRSVALWINNEQTGVVLINVRDTATKFRFFVSAYKNMLKNNTLEILDPTYIRQVPSLKALCRLRVSQNKLTCNKIRNLEIPESLKQYMYSGIPLQQFIPKRFVTRHICSAKGLPLSGYSRYIGWESRGMVSLFACNCDQDILFGKKRGEYLN